MPLVLLQLVFQQHSLFFFLGQEQKSIDFITRNFRRSEVHVAVLFCVRGLYYHLLWLLEQQDSSGLVVASLRVLGLDGSVLDEIFLVRQILVPFVSLIRYGCDSMIAIVKGRYR